MLDLKFIRENTEAVIKNTVNKNEKADISKILEMDDKRRALIQESQDLKNERNVVSKEIAMLKKQNKDAEDKIAAMKQVSDRVKSLDDELREVETELNYLLMRIPNMLSPDVPVGKTEEDNLQIRSWGERITPKEKKNHMDIAKELDIIDFERGAKVSGSGFSFYKGKGAALERALINFMLNFHVEKHGYTELLPPFLVNEQSMQGTGQLPKMADDMYHAQEDNMYLIPTAEVPVTNYHHGEILKEEDLTIKYCAYSPCFRREAGSYGKEVRGFLRVHQFNKVELVKFCKPEKSLSELESLVNDAEDILKALGLEYRLLLLCSGDTSFASSMTYDLEVWAPGEEKWLEVSSCSNFGDFQARRSGIRYKPDPKSKPQYVHTLNGSALATSRIMVALIEANYESGKINIPQPLQSFCGFQHI
ncbi:MAG: serine--tRNA ligase [Bacteroidota bacterium]